MLVSMRCEKEGSALNGKSERGIAFALALAACLLLPRPAAAEEIGEVTTAIKILGANHRIVIEAFDDPKVEGVACFVSRARTGGISGSLGLAEDTSDASVSCQQTGPIRFREELDDGEEVFSRRASILFKHVQVVRFFDEARNALVYLTYSDRVIEGSPQNSVSAVAIREWQTSSTVQPGP
jgi:CreA protein